VPADAPAGLHGRLCGLTSRTRRVKLSSFGSFLVRKKKQRVGRNPKTGTEVPISPRRVIVFKSSPILKQQVNGSQSGTKSPVAELTASAPAR
jgi:integration host factor subunit alpha